MKKINQFIAVLMTTVTLLFLTMSGAQARTVNYNYSYWGGISNGVQIKYCWTTYNWWERTVLQERNGYEQCGIRFV